MVSLLMQIFIIIIIIYIYMTYARIFHFQIYVNQKYFLSRSHHVNPSLIDEVVLLRGVSMESVKLFYKPPAPNGKSKTGFKPKVAVPGL